MVGRAYDPRRPDFVERPLGLTTAGLCGGGGAGALGSGAVVPGCPFALREKSGIERGPFFFIRGPSVSQAAAPPD